MFAPQIELFTSEGGEDKVIGDLDIACIIDGKLHIGEVKESKSDINDELGNKLIELALLVRPDAVVLACSDFDASKRVLEQTVRIAEQVGHLHIKVKPLLPPDSAQHAPTRNQMVQPLAKAAPTNEGQPPDKESQ